MLILNFFLWEDNYIILLKCEFFCIFGGYNKIFYNMIIYFYICFEN